ncbi:hypothetical protein CN918_27860 [Priestia megaterium]|nr:hypothetical protein CN918_27860 [Priestia megaterium]
MLTAIKENKTIFVFNETTTSLREWSDNKLLFCPDCNDPLIFKECANKQHHFAHVSSDCSFPFREPESLEHEKGKTTIYSWLQKQFGTEDCQVEYHITATNQRADTFLLPYTTAVEYQCSPIQSATWERRHQLYNDAGITDFWILGYSMHKYQNPNNPFIHKLNQLEQTLLKEYNRLFYFDVLCNYFIILQPYYQSQNTVYGQEFLFKPSECTFNTESFVLDIKYEYFLNMQMTRQQIQKKIKTEAQKTDRYLKSMRDQDGGKKVLASKRQITLIQDLLKEKKMTVPYKLHGLLKHEASSIIKDLLASKITK